MMNKVFAPRAKSWRWVICVAITLAAPMLTAPATFSQGLPIKPEPSDPNSTAAPAQQAVPNARAEEAMIAYAQGVASLKGGRTDEAITKLKDAITLNPKDASFRYALAQAFDQADKQVNRWYQLRQAVLLKPDHTEAVDEFLTMWQVALSKGVLDVGQSQDQVKAALNDPDVERSEGSIASWQYGFMAVNFEQGKVASMIDLRGLETYPAATEVLEIGFDDRTWSLKRQLIGRTVSKREYQPENPAGDTVANEQNELFTVERLIGLKQQMNARDLMLSMRDSISERFPDVKWTVLYDKDDDTLFEWRLASDQQPAQHELVRLLASEQSQDIHRLAYTAKTIEADNRDAWIKRLNSAKLVPAD